MFSNSYNKYFYSDESNIKSTMIADNKAAGFDDSNEKTLVYEDNSNIINSKSPKCKFYCFWKGLVNIT